MDPNRNNNYGLPQNGGNNNGQHGRQQFSGLPYQVRSIFDIRHRLSYLHERKQIEKYVFFGSVA
jgi:hypothetical protein